MRVQLTRGQWVFFLLAVVIILFVAAFTFCTPATAAEKDAAFYQRTGTKPPVQGESFILFNALYQDKFGALVGYGYQFKSSGVMLQAQIGHLRTGDVSGTVPFVIGCDVYQVRIRHPRTAA